MSQQSGNLPRPSGPEEQAGWLSLAAMPELLLLEAERFEDAHTVIEAVRGGRPVVLNAGRLPAPVGQRLLDYACGGITAMDGQAHRIGDGVFLLAPALTQVATDPG